MTDLTFEKDAQPVSKEDFRMHVELWNLKGHDSVIKADFDDDTGEFVLVVRDYVMFEQSYFIRVKPWEYDAMEAL
jgi:hypothetical protein